MWGNLWGFVGTQEPDPPEAKGTCRFVSAEKTVAVNLWGFATSRAGGQVEQGGSH